MKIRVEARSKFGVKVGDDWLNMGPGMDVTQFERGQEYDVEVTQNGKRKLIVRVNSNGESNATKTVASSSTPTAFVASKGRDFEKEAHGKTRFGTWSAVVQSPAFANLFYAKDVSEKEILETARRWADDGEAYTFGK